MRRAIIAIIIIFILLGLVGNAEYGWTQEPCQSYQGKATQIMEARQLGREYTMIMGEHGNNPITKALVKRAFEYPHYLTEASRKSAVEKFRTFYLKECIID